MRHTVAVVVLAYNEEKSIAACLNSLVNQSVPADEITIVDNNSTDATVNIASKYKVTLIKEAKQGIAHARNTGFDACSKNLILRIDADCIAHPHCIANIVSSFDEESVVGVAGIIASKEFSPKNKFWWGWMNSVYRHIHMKQLGIKHHIMYGSNMAIRRSMWQEVKVYLSTDETNITEDLDLSLRANLHGKIVYNKKAHTKANYLRNINNTNKLRHTDHNTIIRFLSNR